MLEGDGVLLHRKPAGVTSHDVVAGVRRSLPRGVKVGHAGTLDPFATGLLLVLVGRATRAQRFLMGLPKTYRAVARLGWTSDTGDRDGTLTETGPTAGAARDPGGGAASASARLLGREGRRAGGPTSSPAAASDPSSAARPVTVYRAELLWHEGDRAAFEIECSAGTYVRTLVSDLGDAYCEELERTAIGPFRLADADPERLLPLGEALAFLPERAARTRRRRRRSATAGGWRRGRGRRAAPAARRTTAACSRSPSRAMDELQPVVVFAPA